MKACCLNECSRANAITWTPYVRLYVQILIGVVIVDVIRRIRVVEDGTRWSGSGCRLDCKGNHVRCGRHMYGRTTNLQEDRVAELETGIDAALE